VRAFQVAIYAVLFILIAAVLTFPLEYYQNFVLEHQYGMATQNFQSWFGDEVKMFIIQLIVLPLLLIALYGVFRRVPKGWWIVGSIVVMLFFIFAALISPVYIEPLFNKYTPLEDAKIRDPILQLARANQIPVTKVFVVDASRQTKRVSANVSGFLNTTRIALNDNLLKECTLPEIRDVMAHEMGHYVLNHITKFLAFVALLTLLAFGLTKLAFGWALRRWGESWRVRGISDPAGLPLLVLIFAVLSFFATPISSTLVRVQEQEADAFALNAAREPDGAAKVDLKLGKYRKMEPTPWEEFIFFDHPSGRSRIRMAMDWKAAHLPDGTYDANVGKPAD
jgi:STE24 endopeptidase